MRSWLLHTRVFFAHAVKHTLLHILFAFVDILAGLVWLTYCLHTLSCASLCVLLSCCTYHHTVMNPYTHCHKVLLVLFVSHNAHLFLRTLVSSLILARITARVMFAAHTGTMFVTTTTTADPLPLTLLLPPLPLPLPPTTTTPLPLHI